MMTEYSEALENFIKRFGEIIKSLVEALKPIIEGFRYYCKYYGNKRVVHLALHAKKERVRNKNRNRLFNDYLKALQRGVVQ